VDLGSLTPSRLREDKEVRNSVEFGAALQFVREIVLSLLNFAVYIWRLLFFLTDS
jgi:hypothetical protein